MSDEPHWGHLPFFSIKHRRDRHANEEASSDARDLRNPDPYCRTNLRGLTLEPRTAATTTELKAGWSPVPPISRQPLKTGKCYAQADRIGSRLARRSHRSARTVGQLRRRRSSVVH